jgi:iron complex outermembrane receptor protein
MLLVACFAVALPGSLRAQDLKDESSILFLKIPTVQGASRFDQLASEAPASVTVITAEEINRHGWRTLAEIVSSVRGFFTTYDRAYTYVAARGFGRPGDFSNRLLLVLDGQAINEPIYGGGAYGTESAVDVADIERVEFIRGPGSSLYGAGAFFAVVNVVTRRGRDLDGGRAKVVAGSYGTTAAQAYFGKRLTWGPEILVSGQLYRQGGQQPFYREFDNPATHNGIAEFDRDDRRHLLAKVSAGDFTLEGVYNDRSKQVPTASFGTLFDDPREEMRDAVGFVAATWSHPSADGRQSSASLGYHTSSYQGGFPQTDGLYDDESHGRWMSATASTLRPLGRRHKLIGGGEYRLSLAQEQSSWKVGDPSKSFSNDTRGDIWAVYLQDEMRLGRLILNAGARVDHYDSFGGVLSPRAALVYGWNGGAAKLLYGQAFRAPSNFELFYSDGYSTKASPNLNPERIKTWEAVLEQHLTRSMRGVLSVYQYRARDLITQTLDPADNLLVYQNAEHVRGRGIEAEVQFEFPLVQGRASYAYQRTEDLATGTGLTNSPSHLVQLAVSTNLVRDRLTAGFTAQAMSARGPLSGQPAGAFAVGDVLVRGRRLVGGLGGSVGVYNLWNTRYSDPVGAEHVQLMLRQDGRQLRAALSLEF